MSGKAALTAAIALAIAAAGLWYVSRAMPADVLPVPSGNPVIGTVENDTDSYDVQVIFDGEHFEPSEITVARGMRVRFLNESDTEVWPASAIHPTHSLYPEKAEADCLGSSFDSCRRIGKGEYFDFTFEHTGEWRYHDHVHAYKTGVVYVND